MTKLTIVSAVAVLLTLSIGAERASAEDPILQGPSAKVFLECAKKCEKSFYFSEQSDQTFAGLRNACIEGCGYVPDANMPAYQSCSVGCQSMYPYRHGTNAEFAGFQKTCIVGCRRVH